MDVTIEKLESQSQDAIAERLSCQYYFHAVGQGLFASGQFRRGPRSSPVFSWVYDCGSTSSMALVREGLDCLLKSLGDRPELDLVVLSHFDWDHISGMILLLKKFKVNTLVIPLVPLWQRLAFAEGRYIDKASMLFYIDPVAALVGVDGAKIMRIVMVPSSLGSGPAPESPGGRDQTPNFPRGGLDYAEQQRAVLGDLTLSPGATEVSREANAPALGARWPKLYQLGAGGRLTLPGVFEFVPYNESRLSRPMDSAFIAEAEARRKALLAASTDVMRQDALKALKRQYHATYKTSKSRNEISLYMFAGPVKSSGFEGCVFSSGLSGHARAHGSTLQQKFPRCFSGDRASIIYTGDGYLDTHDKWQRLSEYLGPTRTDSLLVFQVMHHGASINWHAGLAKSVAARYAVFSSDPSHSRIGHPHESVKQDFEDASHVCSADKQTGIAIFAMRS